jgi:uncharacterized repeat protein (TIGR03803 family)
MDFKQRKGLAMKTSTNLRRWPELVSNVLPIAHIVGCFLLIGWSGPDATAQSYTALHSFGEPMAGIYPDYAPLAQGADGTLYGVTCYTTMTNWPDLRGTGSGTIYKLNPDGTGFQVLKILAEAEGARPEGGLVVLDSTLYGTTWQGGAHGGGTIWRMNTDGAGFEVLKPFNEQDGDGYQPDPGLVLSGSTLFGTTGGRVSSNGVALGYGTLFRIATDGSGFAVLHFFRDRDDGAGAFSSMVLSEDTLYGTSFSGGIGDNGTVFRINTDGTGFTVLRRFATHDGDLPKGGLVVAGGKLYGTTYGGGIYLPPHTSRGCGTVFSMNTDGSSFTTIKHLDTTAWWPRARLVLSGDRLYGTTLYGGKPHPGHGTIFALNTDGSGFEILKNFAGGGDGNSGGADLLLSDGRLFGTSVTGGDWGNGYVYRLELPGPPIIRRPPIAQTAESGTKVLFTARAESDVNLVFQWSFNDTTALGPGQCRLFTNGNWIATLALDIIAPSNSGNYAVTATDIRGAVANAGTMLNVIPPVDRTIVPAIAVVGDDGAVVDIEGAESLDAAPNWLPLGNINLVGTSNFFFDVAHPQPLQARGFYRARQHVPSSLGPTLHLHLVPAITLAGTIGSALQVQGINQFGPIDAWFPLDTVTLTNASQIYFDTSVIGQPPRLYRLMPMP